MSTLWSNNHRVQQKTKIGRPCGNEPPSEHSQTNHTHSLWAHQQIIGAITNPLTITPAVLPHQFEAV